MSDSDVFSVPDETLPEPGSDGGGGDFDFLPAADAPEASVSKASAYRKQRANKAIYVGIGIAVWILIKLLRAS